MVRKTKKGNVKKNKSLRTVVKHVELYTEFLISF